MSATEEEKVVLAKLAELGKRKEEYDVAEGFAIYKGAAVNYKKIKESFIIRVSETIFENKSAPTSITSLVSTISSAAKTEKTTKTTTTSQSGTAEAVEAEEEERPAIDIKERDSKFHDEELDLLKAVKRVDGAAKAAEKIGIFFNINGTSRTRTNLCTVNKKSYSMNDLATKLFLKDQTRGEKEKTNRDELTVERIASAYAEETASFLKKNNEFIKIKNLDYLGFTKSFFCSEVKRDRVKAALVYKNYVYYAKSWKGGNPFRFSEKMKIYYVSYENYAPSFFDEIDRDIAEDEAAVIRQRENQRRIQL